MERTASLRWTTWLLAPATLALLLSALTLPRHPYTGLSVQGDRVAAVDPGSPGARAGLRPGDRLAPASPEHLRRTLDLDPLGAAAPGRALSLVRDREGSRERVWIVPEALPPAERGLRVLLFAVASGFLLLGGWVWSERRDALTRAFLLLCVAFAGLLAPSPRLPAPFDRVYELSYLVTQVVLPALFVHFFALFPDPGARPRARGAVRFGYLIAAACLAAWLGLEAESAWGPGRARAALAPLQAATAIWFAAGLLAGVVLFASAFVAVRDADDRRRLRVAFLGTLLGAVPFAALVALRNLAPDLSLPGERWSVASTLFVPASFAWAIAVHRVFDFRVALRAIAGLVAAGLVVVALFAIGEGIGRSLWPELGAGVTGSSLTFLALVAALAGPARAWLTALGTRVVPIADEVALGAWSPPERDARAGSDAALLAVACEAVATALRLDGCSAVRIDRGRSAVVAHAGAERAPSLGSGFAEAVSRRRGPQEVHDADLAGEDREALEAAGVHWTLAVPGTPSPAALLLGRRLAGAWLDRHEAHELEHFADHLAVALENADLRREARSRGALDRELAEAHHIQMHRLPRRAPVFPTLDCAAVTLSTEAVGGDYYDFIEGGPRDFMLAVGDAAGHGVPAALVLAGVQARFRDEAQRARTPAELLDALNRELVALDQPEKFMGLVCARVDVAAATIRFANAGLTPPFVRRADGAFEAVIESGLLLGVSPAARYAVSSLELGAGDVVVVCTDGLTEASREGRLFGPEGVQDVLDRHAHRRAADIAEELIQSVRGYADGPLDDLTVAVLKQITSPARVRGGRAKRALKFEPTAADASK